MHSTLNATVVGRKVDNSKVQVIHGKSDHMSNKPRSLLSVSHLLSVPLLSVSLPSSHCAPLTALLTTEKFPFMIDSKPIYKPPLKRKVSNELLVDTDMYKNFSNMKFRPFSTKNQQGCKFSPTVKQREQQTTTNASAQFSKKQQLDREFVVTKKPKKRQQSSLERSSSNCQNNRGLNTEKENISYKNAQPSEASGSHQNSSGLLYKPSQKKHGAQKQGREKQLGKSFQQPQKAQEGTPSPVKQMPQANSKQSKVNRQLQQLVGQGSKKEIKQKPDHANSRSRSKTQNTKQSFNAKADKSAFLKTRKAPRPIVALMHCFRVLH